jgi:hypothetical protein
MEPGRTNPAKNENSRPKGEGVSRKRCDAAGQDREKLPPATKGIRINERLEIIPSRFFDVY